MVAFKAWANGRQRRAEDVTARIDRLLSVEALCAPLCDPRSVEDGTFRLTPNARGYLSLARATELTYDRTVVLTRTSSTTWRSAT